MWLERECRQEFRDDFFERRIDRVSSTTGGSSILDNRRIDRYCVSSIEYRVSTSSTRDPCNRIDSRKATFTDPERGSSTVVRGYNQRSNARGDRPRYQQGQAARIAQAAQQITQEAQQEDNEKQVMKSKETKSKNKKSMESWNRNGERPE